MTAIPADSRRGLVVRGGWEGQSPVAATEPLLRFLDANGFEAYLSGVVATAN